MKDNSYGSFSVRCDVGVPPIASKFLFEMMNSLFAPTQFPVPLRREFAATLWNCSTI